MHLGICARVREHSRYSACLADLKCPNCPCTRHGDRARMLYNAQCRASTFCRQDMKTQTRYDSVWMNTCH